MLQNRYNFDFKFVLLEGGIFQSTNYPEHYISPIGDDIGITTEV